MGVKTPLSLTQAQKLFANYHITALQATKDGVMDTTYIAETNSGAYIIKKYERDITHKINFDAQLLERLSRSGLCVPKLLAQSGEWYLYTKLDGKSPKHITLAHMQKLGQTLAKMHSITDSIKTQKPFFENYPLKEILQQHKAKHFFYYKKLAPLQDTKLKNDGFIHGDIFKDNTLFDKSRLCIFDFIDGGSGSFAFELGVVLLSFNPHARRSFTRLLLQSYNQHVQKKLSLRELETHRKTAAKLYALLRMKHYQNTKRAKELVKLC